MIKNGPNFVHIISLSHDWKNHHRKEFIKSLSESVSDWSKIICFEPPVSLLLHTFIKYPQKFLKWIVGGLRIREVENGIRIFTPFILTHFLFISKFKFLIPVEKKLLEIQIHKVLNKLGLLDFKKIMWLILPDQVHFIGMAKENFVVYDCYDEYTFNNTTNSPLPMKIRDEIDLIHKSNLIFTTSNSLFKKCIRYNNNCHLITNAANTDIFLNSLNSETKIADDISRIKKPIIGYLGNFRNWMDFDLLQILIDKNSDWSFVFIGSCATDCKTILSKFNKKPNFFFLGFKKHSQLPSYLKAFQVGLIPFKINKVTEAVVPNKLFEYLSSGVPVVATPLPDLEQYKNYIDIAETAEDFSVCIKKILVAKNKYRKEFIKFAQENSWKSRTDKVNLIFHKLIQKPY